MRRLFVSILCIALSLSLFAAYKDVDESHWAYEAISTLGELQIITGFPDGTYRGNEVITRYQVAVLMYRLYSVLNDRLEELKSKLNVVEVQMNSQVNEMVINQATQTNLETTDFEKQLADLKMTLNTLSDNVKKLSQDFSTLSNTTSELSTDLVDSKNKYNDLKKMVDDIYAKYSAIYTRLADLENRLNSLTTYINDTSKKIDSVGKSLSDKMTTLEENIAQLKTALAQVEEESKATSESTNVQQSAVMNYDSYASDIADLKAKIDYLTKQQSDYKSIQSDLENIKEEVLRTSEQIDKLKSSQPSVVANNVTQVLPEEQITSILADIEFLKKELIDLRN
ncbi:MAG: S-layer homology domain-containing protein, partial [Fervidobacterium sp.]|nr:S-layer homology domain-containing protein [Fervidobacterium sp.]